MPVKGDDLVGRRQVSPVRTVSSELSATSTHHVRGILGTLGSVRFNLPQILSDDWFLDPDHLCRQGGDEHLYVCEKTS